MPALCVGVGACTHVKFVVSEMRAMVFTRACATELVGLRSGVSAGLLQVGINTSVRVAQGREVFITLRDTPLHAQVDGEV